MEDRISKLAENHRKGYNCCQCVLCAYSDLLGVDESTLFKVSEGFGLGMGMMGTCGAATGMFMAAGLKNSSGNVNEKLTKPETMKLVKELAAEFEKRVGSLECRVIKGVDTGKMLKSCDACIEEGVRIVGEKLFGLE
ncbi:MAG: C-GCAxxG-C-C family protein [Agathobacter sp.]